jgi:uncharacterized membrane protein YidH (DUF202 family)
MVNRTHVGLLAAGLGIALAVISALADRIGDIGVHGFGWKQITGVIAGVGLALAGAGLVGLSRGRGST